MVNTVIFSQGMGCKACQIQQVKGINMQIFEQKHYCLFHSAASENLKYPNVYSSNEKRNSINHLVYTWEHLTAFWLGVTAFMYHLLDPKIRLLFTRAKILAWKCISLIRITKNIHGHININIDTRNQQKAWFMVRKYLNR